MVSTVHKEVGQRCESCRYAESCDPHTCNRDHTASHQCERYMDGFYGNLVLAYPSTCPTTPASSCGTTLSSRSSAVWTTSALKINKISAA
ncbi:hypothetical protein SRHO_G00019120 [Serrasalmus rhombeus]